MKFLKTVNLDVLIKYASYLLILFVVYKPAKKLLVSFGWLKSEDEKALERSVILANNVQEAGLGAVISAERLQSDATALGAAFNLDWHWYNPYSWNEDEKAAVDILVGYHPQTIGLLTFEYKGRFGRSLRGDALRYLSASQYESLKYLFDV